MANSGLPQWLAGAAHRMRADFEDSAELRHAGAKGTEREVIVHHFLDRYLPRHIQAVHLGDIRSVDGQVSPQQDIMIVDLATPRFYGRDGGHQVVPIECVYCLGEVKSVLDQEALESSWTTSAMIKAMPQRAYRPVAGDVRDHGRFFAYGEPSWTFPVASFIVAFDSIDLRKVANRMYALGTRTVRDGATCRSFIDAVFVLNKGYIYWGGERTTTDSLTANDGYLSCRPNPRSPICPVSTSDPGEVLVAMTSWLNDLLADAWMPRFNIGMYLGSASMGTSLGATQPPNGIWTKHDGPTIAISFGPARPKVDRDPPP